MAFAHFGGVPTRILYDNTKIAVAKILSREKRTKTKAFSELQSYYLFADKFGRPAKGNDKGKVEGLVGYVRRNFMVPTVFQQLGRVQGASEFPKSLTWLWRDHDTALAQQTFEQDAEKAKPVFRVAVVNC